MTNLSSRLLSQSHHLTSFDCGKVALNKWLQAEAIRAQAAGTARTYAWTRPNEWDVLAYFAVAPTKIARLDVPGKGLTGGFSTIPGYLLARLALDESLLGQGLGTELLLDALSRIVEAARISGGRLIVVDAIDERAHAFYRHHDFIPAEDTNRLYLKVATAEAVLSHTSAARQHLVQLAAGPPPVPSVGSSSKR